MAYLTDIFDSRAAAAEESARRLSSELGALQRDSARKTARGQEQEEQAASAAARLAELEGELKLQRRALERQRERVRAEERASMAKQHEARTAELEAELAVVRQASSLSEAGLREAGERERQAAAQRIMELEESLQSAQSRAQSVVGDGRAKDEAHERERAALREALDAAEEVTASTASSAAAGAQYEGEAAEYESEARALRRELQAASLQHESQVKAMEAQAEKELRRAKSEAAKLFGELATQPPARPGPAPSIYGKAEGGGGGASIYQ